MKCYVRILLVWIILVIPISTFGNQPTVNAKVTENHHSTSVVPLPVRDEADDDSVVYEYGFEDDWSGWTSVDLTDVPSMWHISEEHAYQNGSSWWCADEEIDGYGNHWLQYLMTPVLDLRDMENLRLRFMFFTAIEDTSNGGPGPDFPEYTGWDGANVWISTDGGEEWEVIEPTQPEYTYESLFSFGYEWLMDPGIPGWAGFSEDWIEAEFNLDEYAGEEEVRIRWAFCSDPAWSVEDGHPEAIGLLVDEMQILAGDNPIWENDGTEVGDMETETMAESYGDFWELTDEDAHTGEFCAHCPIEANLINGLISPPLEIPGEGWYTHFDFWVLCNTQAQEIDGDGNLDDLFDVQIRDENGVWTRIIYDYGGPQHPPPHDFFEDWGYYGPGTWFQSNMEEWRLRLSLTQWAGQTVNLVWRVLTDDNMEHPQGSGLWIDDFRLLTLSQRENNVGIEWMYIGYPVSTEAITACQIMVKNYGMAMQNFIRKSFIVDEIGATPIPPNQEDLLPDSSATYNFRLMFLPYSGMATVTAWANLVGDEEPANNQAVADVVIYPEGMAKLGYDMRLWDDQISFPQYNGPAVLFTPSDDDFADEFDLNAVEVRWSDVVQDEDVTTTLYIFDEINNDIGQELYSREIEVTTDDLYPNVQRIDLSDVDALKNLDEDFFVYFHIDYYDEEHDYCLPQPLGRWISESDPYWGEGHYFVSNGQADSLWNNLEFQIQAVLSEAGTLTEGIDLLASREEIDFGEVWHEKTIRLTAFGKGTEPVTIQGVAVDNEAFTVTNEDEFPISLTASSHTVFSIMFSVEEIGDYSGTLTFDCDDETPPEVVLNATNDVKDDEVTAPIEFTLGTAYPNPFTASEVSLIVYDLSGRKVADLVSGVLNAGAHEVTWNADGLAAGLYLYRLEAGSFSAVQKVVLVK